MPTNPAPSEPSNSKAWAAVITQIRGRLAAATHAAKHSKHPAPTGPLVTPAPIADAVAAAAAADPPAEPPKPVTE